MKDPTRDPGSIPYLNTIANIETIAKIAEIPKITTIAKTAKIDEIAKIAEIAETETVRFLKPFINWVFFEKKDRFFEKKFNFIQNRQKWQTLRECVSKSFVS